MAGSDLMFDLIAALTLGVKEFFAAMPGFGFGLVAGAGKVITVFSDTY